jgi:hypothetical protein
MFGTVIALCFVLLPVLSDVPGSEALVAGIVACEVAVLLEPFFLVSTRDEVDLLVVTHGGRTFALEFEAAVLVRTARSTQALRLTWTCGC